MLTLRIGDGVLADIAASLGNVPPEQGGALLGCAGADVVTSFIHDAPAVVSATRYHNSDWLLDRIAEREWSGPERFKGIVHSHPGGMAVPSGQDRSEFGESLRLIPELGRYLAAIVTHTPDAVLAEHQLVLGNAMFSFFGASWARGDLELLPLRPVVLPIRQALARAGIEPLTPRPVPVANGGGLLLAVPFHGDCEMSLLFPADFPLVPPLLITDDPHSPTALPWDLSLDAEDRLAAALKEHHARPAASPMVSGPTAPDTGWAIPSAPARRNGRWWRSLWPRRAGRTVQRTAGHLFDRTEGILSRELRNRKVLIVGAGSVGSYLAEVLARSGVGELTLMDPDIVEPSNLGRANVTTADVKSTKTEATERRLRAIAPDAAIVGITAGTDDLTTPDLLALVRRADLVVAATDDNSAQQRLNHLAYWTGTPAVFAGLYAGAKGGEIIVSRDGLPCWECSASGARESIGAETRQPATDYGTGRMVAVPGLITDIHFVSAAAAKVCLALLHEPGDSATLAHFLDAPLGRGENYALIGTEPDYWFFPKIFRETLGQHAFQSIWMHTSARPECPVCGPTELRSDPLEYAEDTGDATERRRASHRRHEEARTERRTP